MTRITPLLLGTRQRALNHVTRSRNQRAISPEMNGLHRSSNWFRREQCSADFSTLSDKGSPAFSSVAASSDGGHQLGESERDLIARFASMTPHPLTIQSVLEARSDPRRRVNFIREEFCIRCAERISMIESIPGWEGAEELKEAYERHVRAFLEMRRFKPTKETLDDFTAVAQCIVTPNHDLVGLMIKAMKRLSSERGDIFDEKFVDTFLDEFLLNRLGSNFLMNVFLAESDSRVVIDPNCDVARVCRLTAQAVQRLCRLEMGCSPAVNVESHSAEKGIQIRGRRAVPKDAPTFPYIPDALSYVLQELLKNSCRATVEASESEDEVLRRPISIVVCADERRMIISVNDRAGGIPFDVGKRIWSYLYSTKKKVDSDSNVASELAGYGVGLPLARVYTRYLGGSMNLVSLPGYGTHAYVFLPRLSSEMREVVPDKDYEWALRSNGEFIL